ncbi:MAG TPA: alpha/beta hydrolase family protein [Acidimicrobiales bacterium]|nr:alpha/beta hydrolase family protein [Acidimicrobiales bacterium]
MPDNRVNLILPEDYEARPDLAFPVLYLLHGAGDTYASWAESTNVVELASAFPILVVMPDAGRRSQATWYSDWAEGSWQAETYVAEVLPRYLAAHYRVSPGGAAIAGLSMGGFGAMSLAARHPGRYLAAASFSGVLDTMWGAPGTGELFAELNAEHGTPDQRVWGDQAADAEVWRAHNPTDLVDSLAGLELLVAAGTGTPGGPEGDIDDDGNGYGLEQGVRSMNESFVAALEKVGIPAQVDLYEGGYHGWPYWQAGIRWALPQLAAMLGPAIPASAPAPVGEGRA